MAELWNHCWGTLTCLPLLGIRLVVTLPEFILSGSWGCPGDNGPQYAVKWQ